MSFAPENSFSIFGAFAPRSDQKIERAVLATYSVDLVAALGLVLMLGGQGDLEYAADPIGLAEAFGRVRGKVQIFYQNGRAGVPTKHRRVLLMLDSMLHQVRADERIQSWHPKIALVRYTDRKGKVEWRFWIGSRNLTGSTDIEAGLLLVGHSRGSFRQIPDISRAATGLLPAARWTAAELKELQTARWECPPGISVSRILWRLPGQTSDFIEEAEIAGHAHVVSPFVTRGGLDLLKKSASKITLLTSSESASAVEEGVKLKLHITSSSQPHIGVNKAEDDNDGEPEFIDRPSTGVHAKLLMWRNSRLMIGSANLTRRGLYGPNAEAVALVRISDGTIASSLTDFVMRHPPHTSAPLDPLAQEQRAKQRTLDTQVSALLECAFHLSIADNGLTIRCHQNIDLALVEHKLEVELFSRPSEMKAWEQGRQYLLIATPPVMEREKTTLVVMRLISITDPSVFRNWCLHLPFPDFDIETRDHAVLSAYIGASRFRHWLRAKFEGLEGGSGERWDGTRDSGRNPVSLSSLPALFTLESLLGQWIRNPNEFEERVAEVDSMMSAFRIAFEALPDGQERSAALADLQDVEPFIRNLVATITGDRV
jgi:hypothetical protein